MGNGGASEETSTALHQSFLSQQYQVVAKKEDPAYGRINMLKFPHAENSAAIYIHKLVTTKATDNPEIDQQNFEEKTRKPVPGVTSVVFCAPAPGEAHKHNILFEYSPDSLEGKLERRSLREEELWTLYDFLVQIGIHFEKNRDHYYEICARDILYFDRKMKLCSQYIYDKYTTGILRYFSGNPSYDNDKLHQKVLRHNIKRLGNFLIETALRRPTKINAKNEPEIREEALKMSSFYSQRLSLYAMQLALNKDNWVFSDLKPSNAVVTPIIPFIKLPSSNTSETRISSKLGTTKDESYSGTDPSKVSSGGFMLPKMASVNKENQVSESKTSPKDYYSTQNGYPNISATGFESQIWKESLAAMALREERMQGSIQPHMGMPKPRMSNQDAFNTPPKANLQKSEFVDNPVINKPQNLQRVQGPGSDEKKNSFNRPSDSDRGGFPSSPGMNGASAYPNAEFANQANPYSMDFDIPNEIDGGRSHDSPGPTSKGLDYINYRSKDAHEGPSQRKVEKPAEFDYDSNRPVGTINMDRYLPKAAKLEDGGNFKDQGLKPVGDISRNLADSRKVTPTASPNTSFDASPKHDSHQSSPTSSSNTTGAAASNTTKQVKSIRMKWVAELGKHQRVIEYKDGTSSVDERSDAMEGISSSNGSTLFQSTSPKIHKMSLNDPRFSIGKAQNPDILQTLSTLDLGKQSEGTVKLFLRGPPETGIKEKVMLFQVDLKIHDENTKKHLAKFLRLPVKSE